MLKAAPGCRVNVVTCIHKVILAHMNMNHHADEAPRQHTLVAWLPVLAFVVLSLKNWLPPEYICVAMNPGGKELACGREFARPIVNFVTDMLLLLAGTSLLTSVWLAFQRRLSTLGAAGFVLSCSMCTSVLVGLAYYGPLDSDF
jgi:hypothetical protein